VVEKNQVSGNRSGSTRDLFELAFADQRRRIGPVTMLQELSDHLRAGTLRQRAKFCERLFGTEFRSGDHLCAGRNAGN